MRIEVSVPGIRKERGKLPPPTTLGALRLALPLAGRPLICGELDGPALCEPVTGPRLARRSPPRTRSAPKRRRARPSAPGSEPPAAASRVHLVSDRGALLRPRRLRGVELAVALLDAASPLVSGNGGTDMVRASALACSGDFLLRLAACQGKDLTLRVGELRLPPAGFAFVTRRRPRGLAALAAAYDAPASPGAFQGFEPSRPADARRRVENQGLRPVRFGERRVAAHPDELFAPQHQQQFQRPQCSCAGRARDHDPG